MDLTAGFGIEFNPLDPNHPMATAAANTRIARAATRAMTRNQSMHGSIHHQTGTISQQEQENVQASRYRSPSFQHNVMKVVQGTPECELPAVQKACEDLAFVAGMCNNTMLQIDEENDTLVGSGFNPTEGALTVFTHKIGLPPSYWEDFYGWKKVGMHAFDSKIKRMSVGVVRYLTDEQGNVTPDGQKESRILTKGAPEAILPICTNITNMEHVLQQVDSLASQGFSCF
eukprot:UN07858